MVQTRDSNSHRPFEPRAGTARRLQGGRGHDHRNHQRRAAAPGQRDPSDDDEGEPQRLRRLAGRADPRREGEHTEHEHDEREQPVPNPGIDAPEPVPPRPVHGPNATR